jgi:alkanesulfonate monooxygenase SsuD/methylene tetrahydromethanopterin reductase-like flavin-dependent oxidoreductase (luciferase family)
MPLGLSGPAARSAVIRRRCGARGAGDRFSADPAAEDFGFVGTPDQIIEQMRPFIALGARYFKLDSADFPQVRGLELFIHNVLPVVNG